MNGTIRVAEVIHLSSSAQTLLRQRVLALRARGYDERIVCAPGPYVGSLEAAGIPVHTVELPRSLDPVRLALSLMRLCVLFRRERVQVVHTHCSIPGVIGRLAAWLAGVPVIVHTVHGFHLHPGMPAWQQRLVIAIERACGRFTNLLLTQNHGDLETAVALDIGQPGRRRCVGNGIDLSRFDPSHRAAPGARLVVTCVARFEPVKNHDQLLLAAAILRQRGAPFELWLVGDGPLRARHEATVRVLGLGDVVRFLGYREDVPELLARTQIAVLPSVKEGIPRALLEAMAMEIPVVATRVKGNDEVVRHREDGYLVPLGDAHALAATLALLVEDAALRERLGRNGRQRVLAEFDELVVVRRLDDLIEEEIVRSDPSGTRPANDTQDSTAPGVARSALFRLGAQIVSAPLNVAGMVLLGRALGADRYGEYVWLYAFIPLVASISDLGVGMMVTREMAWRPEDAPSLLGDGLVIKGAMLVLLLILCATVAVPWQSGPAGTALLLLIVLTAAIDPSQDPAAWVLRAHGRHDLEALLLVASQCLWLGALAVGVGWHAAPASLLAATLVAYLARLAVGAGLVVRRWGPPRFTFSPARLGGLLAQAAPYGVAMLGIVLYGRIGMMMLKGLGTTGDVAHFQVAYLLSQPFGFVASAVALAAFPQLAREWRGTPAAAARRVHALAGTLFATAVPLALALVLGAERIVALLFAGRDYGPAAGALRLVAPVLPFVFLNLFARYALAAVAAPAAYLRAVFTGCVVNALLCLWLIPREGLRGACLAYGLAELAVFLVCQHALRRRLARTRAGSSEPVYAPLTGGRTLVPMGASAPGAFACALEAGPAGAEPSARGRSGMPRSSRIPWLERPAPAPEPEPAAADGGPPAERITVLRCGMSDGDVTERLAAIAELPCVEAVLALPDLHAKRDMETPSSLAITTRGALVPEFTSVAVNDGMGLLVTDLEARDLTPERIVRLFARINSHAAAHPLDLNRYSLSPADLVRSLTEGARLGVHRYGFDAQVLERFEWGGRFPVPVAPDALEGLVPGVLHGSRMVRSEMGLNFGGNHFLEAQVVDRVLDANVARDWDVGAGRVVFMYHLGPGPFSGTLLHHYTRREKLPRSRAAALFASKLAFHFAQRAGRGPAAEKWRVHFRRNGWTILPEGSDVATLFQQALALAMNFGFAYRLATAAAVRDALEEEFGVRARLLCDVQHNSIAPERAGGRDVWVSRHNACRLEPARPAIVAGSHDVVSFLARGGAAAAAGLHSYDHGAGHLIERWRRRHPQVVGGERGLRVHMARGRHGRVREQQAVPLASPEPIVGLMECLERHGILEPVVRLRPLATLKN